jgi:hypothetical protein
MGAKENLTEPEDYSILGGCDNIFTARVEGLFSVGGCLRNVFNLDIVGPSEIKISGGGLETYNFTIGKPTNLVIEARNCGEKNTYNVIVTESANVRIKATYCGDISVNFRNLNGEIIESTTIVKSATMVVDGASREFAIQISAEMRERIAAQEQPQSPAIELPAKGVIMVQKQSGPNVAPEQEQLKPYRHPTRVKVDGVYIYYDDPNQAKERGEQESLRARDRGAQQSSRRADSSDNFSSRDPSPDHSRGSSDDDDFGVIEAAIVVGLISD